MNDNKDELSKGRVIRFLEVKFMLFNSYEFIFIFLPITLLGRVFKTIDIDDMFKRKYGYENNET